MHGKVLQTQTHIAYAVSTIQQEMEWMKHNIVLVHLRTNEYICVAKAENALLRCSENESEVGSLNNESICHNKQIYSTQNDF